MIYGFTGTRVGLTSRQCAVLRRRAERATERYGAENITLHHGDCVGADIAMHEIAHDLGWRIEVHPPLNDRLRAFCAADVEHPRRPYLVRNRHIVEACDALIACPKMERMEPRGGTWYTIRYAWEQDCPVVIIWPGGRVTAHREREAAAT